MEQLLVFSVGDIRCGIPLAATSRVIRMVKPLRNKNDRPWEAGVINLHGTIIPVLSMRSLFGFDRSTLRLTDMLIIAHTNSGDVALWVDATDGILESPAVSELPDISDMGQPEIAGLKKNSDGLLIIQNLDLVISRKTPLALGNSTRTHSDVNPVEIFSQTETLLEERARKIAEPEDSASGNAVLEVLKFRLAYREYAIEMNYIREVVLTGEITPVPGTPDYISGICVVRGEIISLVDLRALISIPEKGLTDLNRVIVMTSRHLSFGILADHITGIGILELNKISSPTPGSEPVQCKYIKGVTDGFLTVLDADEFFRDPKMIIEDA
nr:chemotaxis protein CheW [uncultured Methanoregula sp.]